MTPTEILAGHPGKVPPIRVRVDIDGVKQIGYIASSTATGQFRVWVQDRNQRSMGRYYYCDPCEVEPC